MKLAFRLSRINQPRATGWAMLLLVGAFVALGLVADRLAPPGEAGVGLASNLELAGLASPSCWIFWEGQ